MRNARIIDQLVITSDNSAAIGQKEHDVVSVADEVTSYYSTRVVLLEQLAAQALPEEIVLLNFSGADSWSRYVAGIEKVFEEVNLPLPTISGSTETNMPTLQSGFGITMIGRMQHPQPDLNGLRWFTYGRPLVGNQLLVNIEQVADLSLIYRLLSNDKITQVIPVGSKGVRHELTQIIDADASYLQQIPYDLHASAGPSTVVLLAVTEEQQVELEKLLAPLLCRVK